MCQLFSLEKEGNSGSQEKGSQTSRFRLEQSIVQSKGTLVDNSLAWNLCVKEVSRKKSLPLWLEDGQSDGTKGWRVKDWVALLGPSVEIHSPLTQSTTEANNPNCGILRSWTVVWNHNPCPQVYKLLCTLSVSTVVFSGSLLETL